MRTSSIWTCTYSADNNHGCWSHTWGKPGDHPISAKVAKALAEAFLRAHCLGPKDPNIPGVVPKLRCINYLYPYPHADISNALRYGEGRYHIDPEYVIPPGLQKLKDEDDARRQAQSEEANRIRQALALPAQDTVL